MRGFFGTLAVLLAFGSAARAVTMPGEGGGRALYLPIVQREAAAVGLPPALADAVAMVETGYRPDAVGSSGEIGIMQLMPATARQLGFYGSTSELADPATNIRLGVRYLARAWALGGGDICRSLMKYRAGWGETVMTQLSERYCARAVAWLGGTGSALARGVTSPAGTPAPAVQADPYVIAIVPALAAQARLRPVLATAHEMMASVHGMMGMHPPRRMMSDQYRALNDRFLSHQRHYGPFPKPPGSTSDSDD
jgi:hypothetical protein